MKFLITAGHTRESIDPVRYIANHSSGKMGVALAEAVLDAGHEVHLLCGGISVKIPDYITSSKVASAEEMFNAIEKILKFFLVDVLIMAAAVSDFKVSSYSQTKIKKDKKKSFKLQLEPTKDILGAMRTRFGFKGYLVGFAAETHNLEKFAYEKLVKKKCDLIVANDVSKPGIGFGADFNEVFLINKKEKIFIAKKSKNAIAKIIINYCLDNINNS